MSEKRPGLDEEMKRKLNVDGSASGSGDHQETLKSALKPERGKRNQDEEMKTKLKVDGSASGSGDHQETLKSALKPARGKRYQDQDTKKGVTFDLPAASGSVGNQETSKAPVGKRSQDKEVKRKERFGRSASGSVAKQETLNPAMEKRNQARAVDEGRLKAKAQMRESRSRSRISSSSSSKSKDKAPTLVCNKTLTHEDILTGRLRVPTVRFLDKKRAGKHDRMMVPFRDNKGVVWEMEATPQGLSLNWDKFVEAHGLRHNDEIFFYDDGPKSKHFIIEYTRSGSEVQSGSK